MRKNYILLRTQKSCTRFIRSIT
uniref:Uncharacterized protein n=1 Tax=Heterorhabditis bacteriophora TaxID=37862 RepID=A0A1I7WBF8_HETBA